jgi:hypothetical protein
MMTGWIERNALLFEGFNDQQIAQLEAALPDAEHLLGVLEANLSRIERLVNAVNTALPDGSSLVGILNTEMPRIKKVIPVLRMAIAVVNAKQKELRQ